MKRVTAVWRPKKNRDGTLNLDSLGDASAVDIRRWMKARLSGDDPYFPEQPDDLPAPERLIIYIWANAEGRARRLVERGAVSLLKEILKKDRTPGPAETACIQAVLLLLAHIRPIEARDLLEGVVRSSEFRKARFTASGLDRLLVGAWAAQGQRADADLARGLLSKKPYALDAFWVFRGAGARIGPPRPS